MIPTLTIMATAVFAQTYRIYVPFPAGGPADTLARNIAKEMEKQQIIDAFDADVVYGAKKYYEKTYGSNK